MENYLSFKPLKLRVIDILIIQVLTFFNVWAWYISRVTDKSDEPLGILALITVIFFVFFNGKTNYTRQVTKKELDINIVTLITYLLSYSYTGDMIHGIFALFSIGCSFSFLKEKLSPAIFGLLFLALPILASMQFYIGYPLRMISGFFTINLIKMNGFFVVQDGTCLKFGKSLVCIDAPCSGVNMLWMGFYLAFFVSCLYQFNWKKTILVSIVSFISIIAANIIRSTALFYTESGIIQLPEFAHQSIGLISFIMSALIIFIYVNVSEKKCEAQYS